MKKLLLSTLLVVASICGTHAQETPAYNPFFLSFNVGGTYYMNSGTSQLGVPAGGLYVGSWLMRPLAFRIAADAVMAPSYLSHDKGNSTFLFVSTEFMWDVNATFFHVYNKNFLNPFPVYPLIGLGYARRMENPDNDFQAMLGFQLPVRVGRKLDLFLEYKCFFLPSSFEGGDKAGMMHTATIGITRRFKDNTYHHRTEFESRSTAEDWFMGFSMGPNFSAFDLFNNPNWGGKDMFGLAPEIMVGRNFSDVWTIRFQLTGLTAREQYDTINEVSGKGYTFAMLHADFMANVMHAMSFTRGARLGILPYLGAGPIYRFDKPSFTVAADWGIMFRYYINRHSDLFADVKYIMMPPHIGGGDGPNHDILGVGIASITFGYVYNFGQSSARYRMPVNTCPTDM